MKKFIVAAAALAFFGSAYAADLPNKAPAAVPPPPPPPTWTGFYVGGNAGYVVRSDVSGVTNFTQPAPTTNTPVPYTASQSGFIGGFQAGYNYQFAPRWVAGIEGDWDWMGNSSTGFCRTTDTSPPCTDTGRGFLTFNEKTNWLATLRGRIGWTYESLLIYATGGVAWANIDSTTSSNCLVGGCGNNGTANALTANFSDTRTGWAAGVGGELMFARNWSAKLEWIHADVGTETNTLVAPATFGSYAASNSRRVTFDTVRGGLNYRLW